jgi:hypothetical protein
MPGSCGCVRTAFYRNAVILFLLTPTYFLRPFTGGQLKVATVVTFKAQKVATVAPFKAQQVPTLKNAQVGIAQAQGKARTNARPGHQPLVRPLALPSSGCNALFLYCCPQPHDYSPFLPSPSTLPPPLPIGQWK